VRPPSTPNRSHDRTHGLPGHGLPGQDLPGRQTTAGGQNSGENPENKPVRILLADDQRLVRESLGTLLGLLDGIELVAAASDGEEALALIEEHRPEVVLMDLRMPRMDGIEAIGRLRETHPEVRAISLTTYADDESVLAALRAGARGYLTKDASSEDIRTAIMTVAAGDAALDPAIQHHVVAALASEGPPTESSTSCGKGAGAGTELPDDLTPREAEVLALIAEGLTNAEIAERLVVTPATVKSHVNHLFAKAGLRDRAQAVNYAYSHKLAEPPQ
jgi:DNA-binding NarL/FixJ family response regulator